MRKYYTVLPWRMIVLRCFVFAGVALLGLYGQTIYAPRLFAQTSVLDSLTALLRANDASGKTDTATVSILNRLSVEILRLDVKQSFEYAQRGEELALRLNYIPLIALSRNNMGIALWKQGQFASALDALTGALKTYRELGDKRGTAKALNNIGIVYDNRHQPDLAIRYYQDALKLSEEINDKRTQAFLLTNLGSLNADKGNYETALEYHLRGLKIKEELNDTRRMWSSVIGIAVVYTELKKYEEALLYYQRGLDLAKNIGDKEGEAISLTNIADLYIAISNNKEALEAATSALRIAKQENFLMVQESALRTLSKISEISGQENQALDYYKQYAVVRDSIFSKENNEKIAELNAKYEAEKREQQIQLLEQSRKLDLFWRYGLMAGVVFLTLMVVLLLNRYALKRRSEQALTEKNVSLSEANTEITRQQEALVEQAHNIQLANTQLQDTIIQLQRTNQDLEEANAVKMKFLHLAAHDLKNFLSALNTASQSLDTTDNDSVSRQQLTTLLESTQSMHAVMLDVLQTNAQLEQENEIKIKLLSIVAHDLRNPLTSILGLARLLLSGALSKPNASELVEMIITASDNMYRLISDLLDNTALQLGKLELSLQIMDIAELCKDMTEQYQVAAERKGQRIAGTYELECTISGDWRRIVQMIDNLMSNAIKYSPFDTQIFVRVFKTQSMVRLEIRDEGPGLTEEDKQKIFGFFQRLSARPTGGESSSGVGLSSVKKIVELHGGRVWVESLYGEGSTFIVELPFVQSAPPELERLAMTNGNLA